MKKISLVLFLMLFLPIIINAQCDNDSLNEDKELAKNITYEYYYNISSETFNVYFYNVYNNIYLVYNSNVYNPNDKNEVHIENVKQGTYMSISVHSSATDCDPFINSININLEYYNNFYNNSRCEKYRDKLTVCSMEFLPYELDSIMFNNIIRNYESSYTNNTEEVEEVKPVTLYDTIQEFVNEWGILIILILIVSLVTTAIYRNKFRKIKHGI